MKHDIRKFLTKDELDIMKRDAMKILGLAEAPFRDVYENYNARMSGESKYLDLPPANDPIRLYAEKVLTLIDGQAAEIWVYGKGIDYANVDRKMVGTNP